MSTIAIHNLQPELNNLSDLEVTSIVGGSLLTQINTSIINERGLLNIANVVQLNINVSPIKL
jgi:hypothetical protein